MRQSLGVLLLSALVGGCGAADSANTGQTDGVTQAFAMLLELTPAD